VTTLVNSFEGGTSGTTITTGNSGTGSGNAFDATNIGTSATLTYSNTHSAHGSLSCAITTSGTSAACIAAWSTSMGTQTTVWFREYLFFASLPGSDIGIWGAKNGGSSAANLGVHANGKIYIQQTGFSTVLTFTNAMSSGQWYRVEGFVTGDASVGQIEVKLFLGDSTVPIEVQTSAATLNTFGQLTSYDFGQVPALEIGRASCRERV
jgi:hypothetical protein